MAEKEYIVKRLRAQAVYLPEKFSKNAELLDVLMKAADAIEQLSADLERSKDYEAFWEKEANEALKKFQTAVANKPRWIPVTERLPEFEGAVLCMRKSNVYGVRPYQEILYVDEYGFKNYDDIYLADGVVTHWMPLPSPTTEE